MVQCSMCKKSLSWLRDFIETDYEGVILCRECYIEYLRFAGFSEQEIAEVV